ncbi:L-threonine 3-dehydrogenase [Actinomadura rubrisoli]|uniref:L-threonine 3-dehydrogenase n=1 Tax=Actinomadura rubrisoli TaxID=2530368 RepID=A0A4V2YQW7_9ACTN|nr:L-threonine 3-dehydrogenase [Actinomadura rubrisoli]TDD63777.1 L-threonine 3-dehydrogenase [Actinomadura rubrisoli]
MRALVKEGPRAGLRWVEVPKPAPGDDEVLIRVLSTGICGTDLHIYQWDTWAGENVRPPVVLGHEFVGVVESAPAGSGLAEGTRVSGEGHLACGECGTCVSGRRHLCPNSAALGISRDGAFAEYLTLPAVNVWSHTQPLPTETAAVFDPLGNAVHAVTHFGVTGEDVIITGAGPVGLMSSAVARSLGARNILVTEPSEPRRNLAEKMGATLAVDLAPGSADRARSSLGIGDGFTVGLEMSGSADGLDTILDQAAPSCRVAALGLPSDGLEIGWSTVVTKMITLQGIYGRRMFASWQMVAGMLAAGLDISPMITHRFPCTDYERAFAATASGAAGKVIMDWSEPCASAS